MKIMLVSNIAKICLTKLNFTCVSATPSLPCRDDKNQILITFYIKVESVFISTFDVTLQVQVPGN